MTRFISEVGVRSRVCAEISSIKRMFNKQVKGVRFETSWAMGAFRPKSEMRSCIHYLCYNNKKTKTNQKTTTTQFLKT